MNDAENLTAWAQVLGYFATLSGFIGLIYVILLGHAKLDPSSEKLAYTMLGVMGTILTQQSGYFYARMRHILATDPVDDPAPTPVVPSPLPVNPSEQKK